MEALAASISEYGYSIILLAWFIYKDYKFNENILALITEVKEVLVELRTAKRVEGEEA